MRKKIFSALLALAVTLSLAPWALAAERAEDALTRGGTIRLTADLTLTGDVHIARDTVLDLNGRTITGYETFQGYNSELNYDYYDCPALVIEPGAAVTIRNGTLKQVAIDNQGTAELLENLTIDGPNTVNAIGNSGTIRTISRCRITARMRGVGNSGEIGLIDNCDISTTTLCAVDDMKHIARISRCRFICSDPLLGQGLLSRPAGGATVIEDSVLVGGGRGGIAALDLTLEAKNCVIANLNDDAGGGYETWAIRIYNQDPSTPPPRLEGCTLIALDGASASLALTEKEVTEIEGLEVGEPHEVTRVVTEVVYVESMDAVDCTFVPLDGAGDLDTFLAWEMDPAPPSGDPGLAHFTAVNAYTPGQFADVPENHWGSEAVAKVYELGLMKGSGADTFDPEGSVSLGQAVAMAARLNSIYATGTEHFSQGKVWYETYVDYAAENGILRTQYPDYDRPATRAQFAAILAAALPASALEPQNEVADGSIPDVPMSGEDAEAIYALYRAGVLTGGDARGAFAPGEPINRASAAAIIARMADVSLRKSAAENEA